MQDTSHQSDCQRSNSCQATSFAYLWQLAIQPVLTQGLAASDGKLREKNELVAKWLVARPLFI